MKQKKLLFIINSELRPIITFKGGSQVKSKFWLRLKGLVLKVIGEKNEYNAAEATAYDCAPVASDVLDQRAAGR